MRQGTVCPNLNHRRSNAPLRHCIMCGEILNQTIPSRQCTGPDHASKRRQRDLYCSECGLQLREGN